MPTLLERIEDNASKRLPIPPDHHPKQELARYKNFLKVEAHRLKIFHRGGGGGVEICRSRAHVLDLLITHILEAVKQTVKADKSVNAPLAIVATGGYGRGLLNPNSDIDIMFLHGGDLVSHGKPKPFMTALMDGLLLTLWDVGLKVGHSVRSVEDCVSVANSDMQSKTSLIEARLVTGDAGLFDRMQRVVITRCVRGLEDAYVASRIQDQEARRTKFGKSAYMQEPNIKNGSGGLRDYQNLLWMMFFKSRARSILELEQQEMVSPTERKQLDAAHDFLLRVRNDIHYHSNRSGDVLSRALQPAIAHNLGYTDRSPSKRIEKFMRDVYTHMRNIYLITRTVEQRLALIPQPSKLATLRGLIRRGRDRRVRQTVDGFQIVDDCICATSLRIFKEQPRRLMRVFLHAQQRALKIHPDLTQMIRNQVGSVHREFLSDPHVHETFLEILGQRGNVAPTLRVMHDVGLLGKYLPEFGKLTCLVQHEFYHQYTADEHTLLCVEMLDQIPESKEPPFYNYAELLQKIERPFVLYLALLLHDSGKGVPGKDHHMASSRMALTVAKRLGLDGATAHALCLIVEHHQLMAQISQRRDLEDPSVIRNFATLIQSTENLALLTLHTFADSQGTGSGLWNGFKDSLLWMLYHKTYAVLTGTGDFFRAEEKQRELLAEEVRKIMPRSFGEDELNAHFDHLPSRYFQIHGARQVLSHLTIAHQFMHHQLAEDDKALEPVLHWHNEPDRGYTAVTICTWDRPGLFSKIAGSLAAAGLNILSAQIYSRTDGMILDTFLVTGAKSGSLANKAEKEEFERLFKAALTGVVNLPALMARQRSALGAQSVVDEDRIPTRIRFDNETSDYYTVLEVETEDRIGLLYVISQTLSDLHMDIAIAKIATEKGAAIDSFYISSQDSCKVISLEQQKFIAEQLSSAIASLDILETPR